MEAGYDYLLIRGRLQRRIARFTGIFLLVFGFLLLASGGAYYGYSAKAKSNLDDLAAVLQPRTVNAISGSSASNVSLFPGKAVTADSWDNLYGYEPAYLREQALLSGFSPIGETGVTLADIPPSTRILVPAIGVDSTVSELAILDLGDSRTYESPDNTVGHIPESANAGETGTSWFFGHTESPISREGSVFFNLQKVPEKLRNGEDVFIITDNGINQFLYRATSSRVVHQDDLRLDASPKADIKLVSSVPRFVYDYRLVVSGELIALR
ncbi:MAG: sortase [Chloroflexi bacterium]|nr:sortase [Chloroflexota bacterium]